MAGDVEVGPREAENSNLDPFVICPPLLYRKDVKCDFERGG